MWVGGGAPRAGVVLHRWDLLPARLIAPTGCNPLPYSLPLTPRSISWGQAVRPRGEADWFSILSKWLVRSGRGI